MNVLTILFLCLVFFYVHISVLLSVSCFTFLCLCCFCFLANKLVQSSSNSVIKSVLLFELRSSTTVALLCDYKVCLNWNVAKLRHSVNSVYCELVGFS